MVEVFINGEHINYSQLERLPMKNPANSEEVDTAPLAGPAEVDEAVQGAYAAFPAWQDILAAKRGELLRTEAVLAAVEELHHPARQTAHWGAHE